MSTPNGILLAVNSGSSSLKIGCYQRSGEVEEPLLTGSADGIGRGEGSLTLATASGEPLVAQRHLSETQTEALQRFYPQLQAHLPGPVVAVAHRVVHGGPHLLQHQLITPAVMDELEASVHLAPLHIPTALEMIRATEKLFPKLPQYACFDTAFHRTMPPAASHLPLPEHFFEEGIRHYGFHGLSCESVMRRLAPQPPSRVIIAHLGSGSSLTAVRDGVSIDTTMGLSPSGGIPMSSRTGDLDPAVLLTLSRFKGATPDTLEQLINHQGGMAGLSGGESDMRTLLQRKQQGDGAAALAVEVFCRSVRKVVGSYAALLGGLDLLVFTGGIGEHSEELRTEMVKGLDFLFLGPQGKSIRVLPAQEELEMAYQTRALLG